MMYGGNLKSARYVELTPSILFYLVIFKRKAL